MKQFDSPRWIKILVLVLQVFCVVILAGTFLLMALKWGSLPDTVPSHYGLDGQADGWDGKGSLWICPILSLVLFGVLTLLERFPKFWNTGVTLTPQNRDTIYSLLWLMLVVVKTAAVLTISYMTICGALQQPLGAWFLPGTMVLMFVPMIVILVAVYRSK